jgi:hypothetical protein
VIIVTLAVILERTIVMQLCKVMALVGACGDRPRARRDRLVGSSDAAGATGGIAAPTNTAPATAPTINAAPNSSQMERDKAGQFGASWSPHCARQEPENSKSLFGLHPINWSLRRLTMFKSRLGGSR